MSTFSFENSYGRILGVAHNHLFKHLSKLIKAEELCITPEQFAVMSQLWSKDGRSQQELANLTNRDRANVTRILDILEREELVIRQDDPTDRRVFKIFLTKKGKALEKPTATVAQQAIKDAIDGISQKDLDICIKVLLKTIENVK
jgi:MarR family transcriptional regulator, organic hydroperoxide resistance regulator